MTQPTAPLPAASPQAVLTRELSDFLIEFSIALNKHAMYPGGHPALGPAAERVVDRLVRALESRGTLSLGVARNQLIIEGIATDPKHPVLTDLSGRLHRHHLGALTFHKGVTASEVDEVLHLLAVEAERSGEPLGLGPRERLSAWQHVRLHPLTYERLDLVEETPAPEGDAEPEDRGSRARAAQLWLGLARAALAAESAQPDRPTGLPTPTDPALVAQAIRNQRRGTAYDQVIVGYMLQIAEEVKEGASPEDENLRLRVSQLIGELDSDTLSRLLEMGGDRLQRRQFVLNAKDGLAVEAVIDLVRAAGQAERQTVSQSMLRMLRKLASHVRGASPKRRSLADQSVREQVAELVGGWTLQDPNPASYRSALQRIATSGPTGAGAPSRTHHEAEPERILQMALELGAAGPAVADAVARLVDQGRLAEVTQALEASAGTSLAASVWQQVASADTIRRIVTAEPLDVDQLDLLLPRAGMAAAEPMLDALTTSESSQSRRALLDRLVQLGRGVGSLAAQRLKDASWYVQRNMLTILRELPERPPQFDARPFAEHPDARVRREGLRLLFQDPEARDHAICLALMDRDALNVQLGLNAAGEGCPAAAVPVAASLAARSDSENLRVSAIRALGAAGTPEAVAALLALVAPKKRLLWLRRPARTPEYRAAIAALTAFAYQPAVRQALAHLGEG